MPAATAALRDIVVHLDDETLSPRTLDCAARLARDTGARVRALLAWSQTSGLGALEPEAAAIAETASQALRTARLAFATDLTARVGAACGMTIALESAPGRPVAELQRAARTTDVVVVAPHRPGATGGLSAVDITQLVMGAGGPVLAVPHLGTAADAPGAPDAAPMFGRALVAWSGTRESARALRDALPFLGRATHTELVAIQPGDDRAARTSLDAAASWLRHHGVTCTAAMLPPVTPARGLPILGGNAPDVSVGEALLSHAADMQADLLVMGAYGHSRLWEFVLGGVTRTILGAMTVPVLLSH